MQPWIRRHTISGLVCALLSLHGVSMEAATGMLEVQVNDAKTNELLPARLILRASDGTFPGDRLDCIVARWPYIEAHGVFISGRQVFELPTGQTLVTAAHGLEFLAESQTIDVEAGKTVVSIVESRMLRAGVCG